MQLVDTHTHLFAEEFDADRDAMLQRAINNGVSKLLLPNIDSTSLLAMQQLCATYPTNCFPMMGVHPSSINENFEEELALVKKELFGEYKYYGVGEIGLDLYWDKTFYPQQEQAFIQQVQWSIELGLPVSIHTREATDETIEILSSPELKNAFGVFHCFTGTTEQVQKIIDLGFHLGIGGVLTFKNTTLREVLAPIDLKHIVFETDSPYLAPMPYRGKRNESAHVLHIAEKLAEVKNISIEDVAEITTKNARQIFKI
jgi:TatD DNase family protein